MNLTKKEINLLTVLVKGERSTVRFLSGFANPNEMEKMKEEFCDNLIAKLKANKK